MSEKLDHMPANTDQCRYFLLDLEGRLEKAPSCLYFFCRSLALSWKTINPEISCSETLQQCNVCTVSFCINPLAWKLNFNWKNSLWRNPQSVSVQLQERNSCSGKLLMLAAVHVIRGIYFRFNISIQGHDYVLMLQAGGFMHLTSILCIIDLAVPGRGSNHMTPCYSFWINSEQNVCINYSYSGCFCYVSLGGN